MELPPNSFSYPDSKSSELYLDDPIKTLDSVTTQSPSDHCSPPSSSDHSLPDSKSLEICLDHPTNLELIAIWTDTSTSWKDSLSVPLYIKESLFLQTIPLAKDGGVTNWILVDKNLAADQRPILCSCETFRKRSLMSDRDGNVSETVVHGIASVFCPPNYRRRGYVSRMMKELAKILRNWQTRHDRCVGSILYSDIGKSYYEILGWRSTPTNIHFEFQPSRRKDSTQHPARQTPVEDLAKLCERDESMIRKALKAKAERCFTVLPDLDHMLWHISKEEFACDVLFEQIPHAKGAIAGPPGNQIWVLWTHRYYSHPDAELGDNTLYILRLVTEKDNLGNNTELDSEQVSYLVAVIEAAQNEAAEWKLDKVELWHPSPAVQKIIIQSGIEHSVVSRDEDGIASILWYTEKGEDEMAPEWINNEYFAWC